MGGATDDEPVAVGSAERADQSADRQVRVTFLGGRYRRGRYV